MDLLIIVVLIVVAIVLFLIEVFLLPGISLAGLAALACIIYANYHAFTQLGLEAGIITFAISAVAGIGSMIWLMRSKFLDRLALKKNITSTVDIPATEKVKPGDTGIALTRLALMGRAEIGDVITEVKSADGFLDEGTPLTVLRIFEGTIFVKRR